MKLSKIITSQELRKVLDYDKLTGIFVWKDTYIKSKIGCVAGTINSNGYIIITIKRRQYSAHRLAWLYVYGQFPNFDLDHKDRNKSNNTFLNLRPCTDSTNNMNRELQSNNTSGFKGVHFAKDKNKWHSYIYKDLKRYSIGYYDSIEEAYLTREAAEIELFREFSTLT